MLQQDTSTSGPKAAPPEPTAAQPQRHIALAGLGKGAADPGQRRRDDHRRPTASKAREAISVMAVGDSAAHSEAMPKWRCRAAAGA